MRRAIGYVESKLEQMSEGESLLEEREKVIATMQRNLACAYILVYYGVFIPFWCLNIANPPNANVVYCDSMYLVAGMLSVFCTIMELRGEKKVSLRALVLMTLYRSALRFFDVEATYGLELQARAIGRGMLNLGFTHSGLMVYLGCFQDSTASRVMSCFVVVFLAIGVYQFMIQQFPEDLAENYPL